MIFRRFCIVALVGILFFSVFSVEMLPLVGAENHEETNSIQIEIEPAKSAKDITMEKKGGSAIFAVVNKNKPKEIISYPDGDFEIYEEDLFEAFVPEKSRIFAVEHYTGKGKYVTISYYLDASYIVVTYYSDGSVRKSVDNPDFDEIISNFNNETIEIHDKTQTEKFQRSTDELEEIRTIMEERNLTQIDKLKNTVVRQDDQGTVIDIQSNNEATPFSSTKEVHPYPSDPLYMKYKAKNVAFKTTTSQELEDAGYDKYLYMRVYETMDYFTTIKKEREFKPVNTSLDVLTLLWKGVSKATIKGWLLSYSIGVIDDKIDEAIYGIKQAEYEYYGGKEGAVYDRTSEDAYVEVHEEWGRGVASLSWEYNSQKGYHNPHWRHTTRSPALDKPNSNILDETESKYNTNIRVWGIWKWGKGRLGY